MADFAKLPELLKEARAELGKSSPKGRAEEEDQQRQIKFAAIGKCREVIL